MAQVPFISAKSILAKLARNLGGKLPSIYQDDILEWIPEAIDMLSNSKTLETTSTPGINCAGEYVTSNHIVCLPKDLAAILAVEDENGRIIPNGGDITDITNQSSRHRGEDSSARASVFGVNPLTHQTSDGTPTSQPGTSIPIYGSDLELANTDNRSGSFYKIQGNYLQTSFESGFVKLHYLRRVLDKEGYPLLPDNENFKTAVYWYTLMMLIGAGYEHKVFSYKDCDEQFEKFGARAINEITYPSLDDMARINRATVRLIPPYHFYEDFFQGSEQTQTIRK
jgi:hypothetical protein